LADRVFVDTNVLLYAVDTSEKVKDKRAMARARVSELVGQE